MWRKNASALRSLCFGTRRGGRIGNALLRLCGRIKPYCSVRNWSITTRLTFLYGFSALAMLILVVAAAYWSLLANLNRADRKFVDDKVQVIRSILAEHAGDPVPLKQEVEWEQIPSDASPYYAYYSRIAEASLRPIIQTPGIDAALAGAVFPRVDTGQEDAAVARWKSADGRSYLLASAWARVKPRADESRIIQVALDVTMEDAVLGEFQRQLAVLLVFGLMLSAAIGKGVARRGMRPLAAIAQTAERVTVSRLHERVDPSRWPPELTALAAAFDHMLERLEDSFTRLSRFSADLAHELRTPINNLMGETEVTLARVRSTDEYRLVLESSLEEYHRLSQMIERLLFIARAGDGRQALDGIEIDARKALEEVCEFHDSVAEEKGVAVSCEGHAKPWGNALLFRRAVSNLLANALRHTPAGGRVRVTARQSEDGSVEVRVQDTGCGIGAEDLPKVFDRFYRADDARAADPSGMGLGLPIVRSIMQMHGGEATVDSEPGQGTTVTLHFPSREQRQAQDGARHQLG